MADTGSRDRAVALPNVVALVCSAGGLEALTEVLAPLPADLPAAVIVLQHQLPTRTSLLAPILARHCEMAVRAASDGDALIPGEVLVIPPGTHALGTPEGTIALIASDGPPPYRPSADLLLATLAVTFGPRVVAVILSGGGNDGATGAVAVHHCGGTVLAAAEASCAQFAMPAAAIARDDAVDKVLPVEDIADALVLILGAAADCDRLPSEQSG